MFSFQNFTQNKNNLKNEKKIRKEEKLEREINEVVSRFQK